MEVHGNQPNPAQPQSVNSTNAPTNGQITTPQELQGLENALNDLRDSISDHDASKISPNTLSVRDIYDQINSKDPFHLSQTDLAYLSPIFSAAKSGNTDFDGFNITASAVTSSGYSAQDAQMLGVIANALGNTVSQVYSLHGFGSGKALTANVTDLTNKFYQVSNALTMLIEGGTPSPRITVTSIQDLKELLEAFDAIGKAISQVNNPGAPFWSNISRTFSNSSNPMEQEVAEYISAAITDGKKSAPNFRPDIFGALQIDPSLGISSSDVSQIYAVFNGLCHAASGDLQFTGGGKYEHEYADDTINWNVSTVITPGLNQLNNLLKTL